MYPLGVVIKIEIFIVIWSIFTFKINFLQIFLFLHHTNRTLFRLFRLFIGFCFCFDSKYLIFFVFLFIFIFKICFSSKIRSNFFLLMICFSFQFIEQICCLCKNSHCSFTEWKTRKKYEFHNVALSLSKNLKCWKEKKNALIHRFNQLWLA